MLDYERPHWPLMGAYCRRHSEKIMILSDKLRKSDFAQLFDFADSLDPNNSWRDSVSEDPAITRTELADAMLAAYDDIDTHNWINK